MSYMPGMGRAMDDIFEASAENESLDLPKGEFTAKNCKPVNISLVIIGGLLLLFLLNEEIAFLLLGLGVCLAFVLPSMLSYKCIVNKALMREEYYILFFKRKKEIRWSDVAYRKITVGNSKSIKLYDKNKKRLISFDRSIVGFHRIIKLAKRSCIQDIKKMKS